MSAGVFNFIPPGIPTGKRRRRTLIFAAVFRKTGHLFSPSTEELCRDDIRSEIARRLGVPQPVPPLPFELPIGGYSLADAEVWGTDRRWASAWPEPSTPGKRERNTR